MLIFRALIGRPGFGPLRAAALIAAMWGNCAAQNIAAPVEIHLPLLAKVLEYDRALKEPDNRKFMLGVIYQSSWGPSAAVLEEVLTVAGRTSFSVRRLAVQVVPIDVSGDADVREFIRKYSLEILYVAPVRGISIEEIERASEARHCRTITGVPQFVEEGIEIGIDLRNDRPLIVINLPAAKACGADLSAQVLRLARIVE